MARYISAALTDERNEVEATRESAMAAILSGQMSEAWTLLSNARTYLTKPQAKRTARALVEAGRKDDALVVLARVMGREAAERELAPAPTATVGDILVCSWGYDQTNIDFYEVIATSGSMATIREIGSQIVSADRGYEMVAAVRGRFIGEAKRVRVQKGWRDGYCVKVGDHHAYPWSGNPEHQTASGWGH